jgi:5-methylcytosine-specific restriction enzyme subunit McrC
MTSRRRLPVPWRAELERLSEGQVLIGVGLSRAEAAALNACELVSVQPDGDAWKVTAAHAVGAVRVGELVVRVRPKIGAVKALQLLARSHGVRHLHLDTAALRLGADPDLHAVLALLFSEEASRALALGPLRGYRTEDQTLPVVRGRLRIRDQELRRFGILIPLEVTVDEWTTDTDENRRVRAAARRLLELPGVPASVRAGLVRVDRLLAEAWLAPAGHTLPSWTPTRLNARQHQLLRLADLVLSEQTFEHTAGAVQARGFVLKMEKLFEDLVTRLLQEADDSVRVLPQATYRLDSKKRLTIKPDLVFVRDGKPVGVADTKYKVLDDQGKIRNEDGYQLITYCKRLELEVGHLIYAAGQLPNDPFEIPWAGVRLEVQKIDLTRDLADVEQQVLELRRSILKAPPATASLASLPQPPNVVPST